MLEIKFGPMEDDINVMHRYRDSIVVKWMKVCSLSMIHLVPMLCFHILIEDEFKI